MKHMGATSTKTAHKSGVKVSVIAMMALCLPGMWCSFSLVQAASPITSSGLNTQVTLSATPPTGKTQYDITGGTRPGGGTNLFHSFGDFNVPNNNIANFLNDSGLPTSNILGRVTGGNISNIFGTIQTTGFGNANLFMMNPAGFLFGPNATINVGGMVAFTTADYLRLGDGKLFNAIPDATADALLSAAPVAAFGFLGSNPGAITVQGSQLSVTPGQSISLVGGNITIQSGTLDDGTVQPARLSAPNGQINLATAASPGEFLLQGLQGTSINPALLTGPNISGASFTSFGTVHLAPASTVDVSQTGNGKVSIRGGQFLVDIQNASLSTASSTAPAVTTPGQDTIALGGRSWIFTKTSSADHGPDVEIVADRIQVPPTTPPAPVTIRTDTTGSGDGGSINLTANQNLDLSTTSLFTNSSSPATGNAGNINLTSTNGNISMINGTFIRSLSGTLGNTGTITVSAPHGDILLDNSPITDQIFGPGFVGGTGGGINITANNLTLRNSLTNISIDNFNVNPQVPGAITITLSGNLSLSGQAKIQTIARGPAPAAADLNISANNVSISGKSTLNTETRSSGPGGHLNIVADNLQLTTGGQIKSGTALGADPLTGTPVIPSGHGGTISIQGHSGPAASVLIDGAGSAIFTNTVGTGAAGNTNIAAQSVTIQNGGTISAATSGTAPSATGGTILVKADTVTLNTGGTMTAASTGPGASGEVVVEGLASPAQSILVDGSGSGIFTNTSGTGPGGDIHLSANSVMLQNGAQVSSSSTGTGNAGGITINAGNQFTMTNSSVTTQANQASGGTIKITTTPSGTVQLTNSTISASVLDGTGGGGSVNIDPQFVILQNSQILAQAVQGPGGNISITTNLLLPDANSVISASSQFGVNGTITIQSPNAPASGKIQPLGKSPLLATTLLNQRCAALAGGDFSSFTVAGRDSLPAEPNSWLASPLAALSVDARPAVRGEGLAGMSLGASLGDETALLSLRQIAPPGFLTQAFAVDWSAGCQS